MRIIGGKYKGKRLTAPKGLPVRPTTDFAKEALFNILNHQINYEEIAALDLFSGTGNLSYELGSRDCPEITSIDANYKCYQFIKQTANDLKFNLHPIKADVFKFLNKPAQKQFDLIVADPPYDLKNIYQIPELVFKNSWLKPEGLLVVEHGKETDLSELKGFEQTRKYGHVHFSFFRIN